LSLFSVQVKDPFRSALQRETPQGFERGKHQTVWKDKTGRHRVKRERRMNRNTDTETEEGHILKRSARTKTTRQETAPKVLSEETSGNETESTITEVDPRDESREWSTEAVSGVEYAGMNSSEQNKGAGDDKSGIDSGRRNTPNFGTVDVMQMFMAENRRRDEKNKRRDEMERLRRNEEARRREDDIRR